MMSEEDRVDENMVSEPTTGEGMSSSDEIVHLLLMTHAALRENQPRRKVLL